MNVNLINIYKQLFTLNPPNYENGKCLDVVDDIYMLSDEEELYYNMFLSLEPKRCCIPYFIDEYSVATNSIEGTVEAILFYDKRYKVHYTTESLYEIILDSLQKEVNQKGLNYLLVRNPKEIDTIIDASNCHEYDLCWDYIDKEISDLDTKVKLEFEEGSCSDLREVDLAQEPYPDIELHRFGYSVDLPENERWFVMKEAAEDIGFCTVINNINYLLAKARKMKPKDNVSIFKLEHDLKKLRRYY